jgi:chromosome segregation ATPase
MTETTIEQLARRVAALEQLAETTEILDRTEAVAARQRQLVEQRRTELLEKLSSTQDEHTEALAELKAGQDALRDEVRSGNARIVELLTNLVGLNPNAE